MDTATEAPPKTIEYGGLIWNFEKRDGVQYRVIKDKIEMRIYQYPEGYWLWHVEFVNLISEELKKSGIPLSAHSIVDTREEALFMCINAFDMWLDGMQRALLLFRPKDQYAQGFRAGQEEIKAKIAEVVL